MHLEYENQHIIPYHKYQQQVRSRITVQYSTISPVPCHAGNLSKDHALCDKECAEDQGENIEDVPDQPHGNDENMDEENYHMDEAEIEWFNDSDSDSEGHLGWFQILFSTVQSVLYSTVNKFGQTF